MKSSHWFKSLLFRFTPLTRVGESEQRLLYSAGYISTAHKFSLFGFTAKAHQWATIWRFLPAIWFYSDCTIFWTRFNCSSTVYQPTSAHFKVYLPTFQHLPTVQTLKCTNLRCKISPVLCLVTSFECSAIFTVRQQCQISLLCYSVGSHCSVRGFVADSLAWILSIPASSGWKGKLWKWKLILEKLWKWNIIFKRLWKWNIYFGNKICQP